MLEFDAGAITKTFLGETHNCNLEEIFKNRTKAVSNMMDRIWGKEKPDGFPEAGFFKEADGKTLESRKMQVLNTARFQKEDEMKVQSGMNAVLAAFFGNDFIKPDNTYEAADSSNMKLQILMPDNKPHYMTYNRETNKFQIDENPVPAPALAPKPSLWDRIKSFFGRNVESVNIYKESERKLKIYNDFCKKGEDFQKAKEAQKAKAADMPKAEEPEKAVESVKAKEAQKEQTKQKTDEKTVINGNKVKSPEERRMNLDTPVKDKEVEAFRLEVQAKVNKYPKLERAGEAAVKAMKELKISEQVKFNTEIQKVMTTGHSPVFNNMGVITAFNIIASNPEQLLNSDTKTALQKKMAMSHNFKKATGFAPVSKDQPLPSETTLDVSLIKNFVDSKGMNIKDSFRTICSDCGITYPEKNLQANTRQKVLNNPDKVLCA